MSHQPNCSRTHEVSDSPCGKQHVPGSPCDYCGKDTPTDGSACPDCWTPIPNNLADAKALLALGGLSVGTPRHEVPCIFCGMEHDNGTACPDVYPTRNEVGPMSRPKHLELYSCEGGSARGYERAGFDVYCVDLFEDYSRKRCPFATHKGDVLDVLRRLIAGERIAFTHLDGSVEWLGLSDFASIGASPPCQHASAGTRAQDRSKYPRLIEPTRELLIATGLPYVIENVKGADLRDPILLCGTMFGLSTYDDDGTPLEMWRHRLFESNVDLATPVVMGGLGRRRECAHGWFSDQVAGSYGGARRDKDEARNVRHGGYVPSKRVQQELLGIDWMTERGMHQSIPPVYTEHIGRQLLAHIESERAA